MRYRKQSTHWFEFHKKINDIIDENPCLYYSLAQEDGYQHDPEKCNHKENKDAKPT